MSTPSAETLDQDPPESPGEDAFGSEAPVDHCILAHEVFTRLPDISFRRAGTDDTPVMIVPFGEREASVPLRSLQREFAIGDDTPDGRMLGLIAESLDYVTGIRPGDKLPDEVVSGKASWDPALHHRQRAATRLRLKLLAWLDPEAAAGLGDPAELGTRLDRDPALRTLVQTAFREAAAALDLPGPDDLVALVETLSEEFAFVEALRERLLMRVQTLIDRVDRLAQSGVRNDVNRHETLSQVQRLATLAITQYRARFNDIDAQTGEILSTLRNAVSQVAYVRSNRDWLYRCLRAWEPVFKEWDKATHATDETLWHVVNLTYQFLARRYMPTSEWPSFNSLRQRGAPKKPQHVMTW